MYFFLSGYQVLFRFLIFKSGSEFKGVNVSKYFGNFDDSNFLGFLICMEFKRFQLIIRLHPLVSELSNRPIISN